MPAEILEAGIRNDFGQRQDDFADVGDFSAIRGAAVQFDQDRRVIGDGIDEHIEHDLADRVAAESASGNVETGVQQGVVREVLRLEVYVCDAAGNCHLPDDVVRVIRIHNSRVTDDRGAVAGKSVDLQRIGTAFFSDRQRDRLGTVEEQFQALDIGLGGIHAFQWPPIVIGQRYDRRIGRTATAPRFRVRISAFVNAYVIHLHGLRKYGACIRITDGIAANREIQEQVKCLVEGRVLQAECVGAERVIQAVRICRVVDPVFVDDLCLEVLAVDEKANPAFFPLQGIFMKARIGIGRELRR